MAREAVHAALRESKQFEDRQKLEEALSAVERALEVDEGVTWKVVVRLGALCNRLASESENSAKYLAKAEDSLSNWVRQCRVEKVAVHDHIVQVYALTLNNWGALHQKQGNYHVALKYFLRAVKVLETSSSQDVNIIGMFAKTRFNISLLYTELRRYSDAVSQGEKALVYLDKEYKQRRLLGDEKKLKDTVCTYLWVYFTLGTAHQELRNHTDMKHSFIQGLELGKHHFNSDHPLLLMLKEGLNPTLRTRRLQHTSTHRVILKDTAAFHERHASAVHSIDSSPARKTDRDVKEPGKYYTDRELELLQKHFNERSKVKFVSADDFFFHKIKGILKLENDIQWIKPDLGLITKEDDELKKKIIELRLRRHAQHRKTENLGVDYIKTRIELLDRQHKVESRKNAVQRKSQLKSRPKLDLKKTAVKPPRPLSTCGTQGNLVNFQAAKDVIETVMEEVTQDLKKIQSMQTGVMVKRRSIGKTSQLAKSIWNQQKHTVVTKTLLSAFQSL